MTRLLHVSASPRGEASESLALARTFLDEVRATRTDVVVLEPTHPMAGRFGHQVVQVIAAANHDGTSTTVIGLRHEAVVDRVAAAVDASSPTRGIGTGRQGAERHGRRSRGSGRRTTGGQHGPEKQ